MLLVQNHEQLVQRINQLAETLPKIWCKETSGLPDLWTPANPSVGQCHPTSRLVHVLFGGVIIHQTLRPKAGGKTFFVYSHCVNEINGVRFDLTSAQLGAFPHVVWRERVFPEQERNYFDKEWPGMAKMIHLFFERYERISGVKIIAR